MPLRNEPRGPDLRAQVLLVLTAKLVGYGFAFLLPLVVVRLLSTSEFGIYRMSFQIVATCVALLPLGFGMSAYYFLSREEERRAPAVLNILIVNITVGVLAYVALTLYPQLIAWIFTSRELQSIASQIGLVILVWTVATLLDVIPMANQEPRLAATLGACMQALRALAMIAAAIYGGTVEWILRAAILVGLVQVAILLLYSRRRFPRLFALPRWSFVCAQFKYAVPYGLSGVAWIVQNDAHYYFVGRIFGESTFAVYAVGFSLVPIMLIARESLAGILMPRIAGLELQGSIAEIARLTLRAMQKLALLYFPLYAFLSVTAVTLITTLYTEKYAQSVSIFLVNLVTLPCGILLVDPVVRAFPELGRRMLRVSVALTVTMLLTLAILATSLPVAGIAMIVVATTVTHSLIALTLAARRLGLTWEDVRRLRDVSLVGLSAFIAGVPTYFVHHWLLYSADQWSLPGFVRGMVVLSASAFVYGAGYLICLRTLKLLDPADVDQIRRWLRPSARS